MVAPRRYSKAIPIGESENLRLKKHMPRLHKGRAESIHALALADSARCSSSSGSLCRRCASAPASPPAPHIIHLKTSPYTRLGSHLPHHITITTFTYSLQHAHASPLLSAAWPTLSPRTTRSALPPSSTRARKADRTHHRPFLFRQQQI